MDRYVFFYSVVLRVRGVRESDVMGGVAILHYVQTNAAS